MIDELPASFTNLSSLKICQLSKNRLKHLPDDFGALTTLRELFLDSNMLRNLPPSMSNLVNLEVLDLTENKLKEVPKDILRSMTKLKALNMFYNKFDLPLIEIPYIVKKTHYAEKNPELKNNWRGRNNGPSESEIQSSQSEIVTNSVSKPAERDSSSFDDDDDEQNAVDDDSSAEEDWDAQVVASSSGSSELAHYMQTAIAYDNDDDNEDWDSEVKRNPSRQLSSDLEEGQFADLDDDEPSGKVVRPILPSPVRFDDYGNASRPIDFAVHHHRQTPYIHHAFNINRRLYSPGPWVEGQFDSDMDEKDLEQEGLQITVNTS